MVCDGAGNDGGSAGGLDGGSAGGLGGALLAADEV